MDTRLLRTKAATEDCERHLNASGASGTEIESYLTQHILVILCAEMQQEIYRIAEVRAETSKDEDLVRYVSSSGRRILRSIKKDEIATFIGMFGVEAKDRLNALVNDADVTIYNNAVSNRHDVAHKHGTQITFTELKDATWVAERLLDAVEQSLKKTGAANAI